MKLGAAIAEIMKREGIEILCGYPVNHLIEFAANANIRPIMVRQERIGLHMADAISRVTSGGSIGAFCMQHGPGSENAMGGVAQCYGESVPVLVEVPSDMWTVELPGPLDFEPVLATRYGPDPADVKRAAASLMWRGSAP